MCNIDNTALWNYVMHPHVNWKPLSTYRMSSSLAFKVMLTSSEFPASSLLTSSLPWLCFILIFLNSRIAYFNTCKILKIDRSLVDNMYTWDTLPSVGGFLRMIRFHALHHSAVRGSHKPLVGRKRCVTMAAVHLKDIKLAHRYVLLWKRGARKSTHCCVAVARRYPQPRRVVGLRLYCDTRISLVHVNHMSDEFTVCSWDLNP